VSEKFLDGTDVIAIFEEVGRKAVAERMAGDAFADAGALDSLVNGALEDGLVHVVSALDFGLGIDPTAVLGKHPLPGPLAGRGGVLLGQRVGQEHPAPALSEVFLMDAADAGQVVLQQRNQGRGKHRHAVFVSLSRADKHLGPFEIEVLDPQLEALDDAHPGSIEEFHGQEVGTGEVDEDVPQFVPVEDDGKSTGLLGADDTPEVPHGALENRAIEKQEGGERLVLGRGRHILFDGQAGEEGIDLGLTGGGGLARMEGPGVPLDPVKVGFPGPGAVVADFQGIPATGEEFRPKGGANGGVFDPDHRGNQIRVRIAGPVGADRSDGLAGVGKGRPQEFEGIGAVGNGPDSFGGNPQMSRDRLNEGPEPIKILRGSGRVADSKASTGMVGNRDCQFESSSTATVATHKPLCLSVAASARKGGDPGLGWLMVHGFRSGPMGQMAKGPWL